MSSRWKDIVKDVKAFVKEDVVPALHKAAKDIKDFVKEDVVPTWHKAVKDVKDFFNEKQAEPTPKIIPVVEVINEATPTPTPEATQEDVKEEVSSIVAPTSEALTVSSDGEVVHDEVPLAGASE